MVLFPVCRNRITSTIDTNKINRTFCREFQRNGFNIVIIIFIFCLFLSKSEIKLVGRKKYFVIVYVVRNVKSSGAIGLECALDFAELWIAATRSKLSLSRIWNTFAMLLRHWLKAIEREREKNWVENEEFTTK